MKIETTLRAVIEGLEPAREFTDTEMPVKLSYRLAKILRKADTELRDFYKVRDDLVAGNTLSQAEIEEKLNELLDEPLELAGVQPLTFEEVESINPNIKPKYLMALMGWAILEEPDGNER